jgi:hypothetical protein
LTILISGVSTAFKWLTLASAGSLVFAVQLGVQTIPNLLSGMLRTRVDKKAIETIS